MLTLTYGTGVLSFTVAPATVPPNHLRSFFNYLFALMSISSRVVAVCFCILVMFSEARAEPASPTEVVNSVQDTLLSVMKDAEDLGTAGRYAMLAPTLGQAFDFQKMIRFASGSSWKTATPEQRKKLSDAFTRLSISNYAARFNGFSGEVFETLGQRDGPRDSILVDTQIVRTVDSPVAITYVLTESNEQWRIVDLVLDKKVSEMAIRRSEYNSILRDGGPDKLADVLNEQADKLLAK